MKKILLLILFSFLILPTTTSFATVKQERTEQKMVIQKQVNDVAEVQFCIDSTFEIYDYDYRILKIDNYAQTSKTEVQISQPVDFILSRVNFITDINSRAIIKENLLFRKDVVLTLSRYVPFHV